MSAVVRKSPSVVVRPSEPVMATVNINLSPYDKINSAMTPTAFLVFDHPIDKPAETIRRGLSQALVHYHPISGRLAAGASADEVHIKCTGEGVHFVAASANCAMKDVKFFDRALVTRTLPDELAIYYPAEGCGLTNPLLMMQVTEFSCGGFIVGVTWNHAIADAAGMGQFLQAIGELARGLSSPSILPVRCDNSLMVGNQFINGVIRYTLPPFDMDYMSLLDITVPSSLINRIKDKFYGHSDGQFCTTFEAVTAVLWQCRTRAIISDPDIPTVLYFTVNARQYVGAKNGYYGNCVTGQVVIATSGAVANGDVMEVVKMIRRAKAQIPDQFKKDGDNNMRQILAMLGYNFFMLTCWRNLGLEAADFGGGRPSRVMTYTQQRMILPLCVPCLPCEGNSGSNVLSICVKEEHADAFLGELERFT